MIEQSGQVERAREEAVNVILGELLRENALAARAERRRRREQPDILVTLPTRDQVVIECKWSSSRSSLERQLGDRIAQFPEAMAIIGVLYPDSIRLAEDTRAALLATADIQWWIHGSQGAARPLFERRTGSVLDFASHLSAIPLELEQVDRVVAAANAVGIAVDQAAMAMRAHERLSELVAALIAETDQEENKLAALKISALVLFNALAFHERLARIDSRVSTVGEALTGGMSSLRDIWQHICETIDYVPVFELAQQIVGELEKEADVGEQTLAVLSRALGQTRNLDGHDLAGRLFHTLLSNAKFLGAYYTSIPAATMLAHLVFDGWPPRVDWSDVTFPSSLNVADLACGTGTLLMAVASEAERRHLQAGGRDSDRLHKNMVEFALHGYDVQLSAIHFAATSLAMLNPRIEFDHMNLWVMQHGVESDGIHLGSLDYLDGRDVAPAQYGLRGMPQSAKSIAATRISGQRTAAHSETQMARLPTLDLAIMNPPFTRSSGKINLLFGNMPADQRESMQSELKRRLRTQLGSATAGLGSAFVATAARRLRQGEGRLALVLPISVTSGPSWRQTRELIERDFLLDMVITSHDPGRWNFSDSTDLSEALVIATRRPELTTPRQAGAHHGTDPESTIQNHRTTFVNLWRNPDTFVDAQRMARAIAQATPATVESDGTTLLRLDGHDVGEAVSIRQSEFEGEKWPGGQFARVDVTRSAMSLLRVHEVRVPGRGSVSVPLDLLTNLGTLGPDRRDIMDGFTYTDSVTAYPMVSGHDEQTHTRLLVRPDRFLSPLATPRPGRRLKRLSQLWPRAGRLLLAERLWLATTRVVAMYADQPVLSNVWWEIRNGDVRHDKALCLYLNSTIGVLELLAMRNTTRAGWVALKKADLQRLPVLDVRALSEEQLDAFSDLFDDVAEMEFMRLPEMADDPARKALDDGLSSILGLPDLAPLRRLISTEPVVSNQRL